MTFGPDGEVVHVPVALGFIGDALALKAFLWSARPFSRVGICGVIIFLLPWSGGFL